MKMGKLFRNWKARLVMAFVLTATLSIVATFASYRNVQRMESDSLLQTRTLAVIAQLETLRSDIKDAQRAERGYLITGNGNYLEPYHSATNSIGQSVDSLARLVSDSASQSTRVRQIKALVDEELAVIAAGITQRTASAPDAPPATFLKPEERELMRQIESLVREAVSAERSLLEERTAKAEGAAVQTRLTILLTSAGGLAIIGLLLLAMARDYSRRLSAERDLATAHTELQLWVKELESRNLEIQQLNEVAEALQSCQNLDESYAMIRHHCTRMFPDLSGTLYIYAASRNVIESTVAWGSGKAQQHFAPDECWGLRKSRPFVVNSPSHDLCCRHVDAATVGCTLCLPLTAQGQTIGMLHLYNPSHAGGTMPVRAQREFERCAKLATVLSEHVAINLSNIIMKESLRGLSIRDALTGLFNRRYMEETIHREAERSLRHRTPLSVIAIDLDHFKRINDTHGHDAGDAVLRSLGQLLQSRCRTEDIACRLGGEEFLLVLPGMESAVAARRADEIRTAMKSLVSNFGSTCIANVTLSAGVASLSDRILGVPELLKAADEALYAAKKAGRDRVKIATVAPTSQFDSVNALLARVIEPAG
jgi:diguanylate cyclase (GGDEF)-like protein